MKLRNKRTGEIKEVEPITIGGFRSLAELNKEWEDYEEPKEYWYIEPNGVIARIDEWDCCTDSDIEIMKTLGNYFDTREEAEKAVEKLKAWKRLKDKGFHFQYWISEPYGNHIYFWVNTDEWDSKCSKDLDLLFEVEE